MKNSKLKKVFAAALFFAAIGIVSILNVSFVKAVDFSAPSIIVSLDSSSPSSKTITAGSAEVVMLSFKISNTYNREVNVTNISLSMTGTATPDDITKVYLFDGINLLGSSGLGRGGSGYNFTSFGTDSQSCYPKCPSFVLIPANSSKVITVKADIASTLSANQITSSLSSDLFTAERLPVSGVPVTGNMMTIIGNVFPPSITLLSPNGGESWTIGSTQTIKWTSNLQSTEKVNIYLYDESSAISALPTMIGWLTVNDGSESWTVSNWIVPKDNVFRIEIKKADNVLINDKSDGPFSIVAASTLPDLVINDLQTADENGQSYLKFVIGNTGVATRDGQIISVKAEDLETGYIYSSGYSNSLASTTKILSSKPLITKNPDVANYKLRATIDYANIINESNENNNTLEKTITVSNSNATYQATNLKVNKKAYQSNEKITLELWSFYDNVGEYPVDIWLTKNLLQGTAEKKLLASAFYVSGHSFKEIDIANTNYFNSNGSGEYTISTCKVNACTETIDGKLVFNSNSSPDSTFTATIATTDNSKYPGFAIEPVKKVFQSNENLVVNLRRLDGVNQAYLVDLWAQKVVQSGDAKKYQIQINTPVGSSNYVTTNDIDRMTVFTEGGNGEYSLVTCPPTGCVMGAINAISVKIEGFKDVEREEPKLEPTQEPNKPNADTQLTDINNSAKSLNDGKISELLSEIKQLRNELREQTAELKYLKMFATEMKALNSNMQTAIKTFITYGVDSNTVKLGAGERAAVINSYKTAFDKLPETEAELTDVIKIANGRFPSITSNRAEKQAKEQFIKIYKRIADMNNANDNAALKVVAYGLRQKAENRNLNSERSGIKIFKNIYGRLPKTTADWNIMQAITYSGATR